MSETEQNNGKSLNAIEKLLGKLSTKAIPTWDIGEEGRPIKSHIRRFENAVGGNLEMTETEKAREFAATMRGQAAVYVDELKEEIRTNYTKLKEEMLATFHKEKSVNVLMKEFHDMKWRKNKQTIREFAAVLNIAWRQISGADKEEDEKDAALSEAILKNRLLDSIKEAAPKFGTGLEFYITDSTKSFKDLANLAEIKYDTFNENFERCEESKWDDDPIFFQHGEYNDSENNARRNAKEKNDKGTQTNNLKFLEQTKKKDENWSSLGNESEFNEYEPIYYRDENSDSELDISDYKESEANEESKINDDRKARYSRNNINHYKRTSNDYIEKDYYYKNDYDYQDQDANQFEDDETDSYYIDSEYNEFNDYDTRSDYDTDESEYL